MKAIVLAITLSSVLHSGCSYNSQTGWAGPSFKKLEKERQKEKDQAEQQASQAKLNDYINKR